LEANKDNDELKNATDALAKRYLAPAATTNPSVTVEVLAKRTDKAATWNATSLKNTGEIEVGVEGELDVATPTVTIGDHGDLQNAVDALLATYTWKTSGLNGSSTEEQTLNVVPTKDGVTLNLGGESNTNLLTAILEADQSQEAANVEKQMKSDRLNLTLAVPTVGVTLCAATRNITLSWNVTNPSDVVATSDANIQQATVAAPTVSTNSTDEDVANMVESINTVLEQYEWRTVGLQNKEGKQTSIAIVPYVKATDEAEATALELNKDGNNGNVLNAILAANATTITKPGRVNLTSANPTVNVTVLKAVTDLELTWQSTITITGVEPSEANNQATYKITGEELKLTSTSTDTNVTALLNVLNPIVQGYTWKTTDLSKNKTTSVKIVPEGVTIEAEQTVLEAILKANENNKALSDALDALKTKSRLTPTTATNSEPTATVTILEEKTAHTVSWNATTVSNSNVKIEVGSDEVEVNAPTVTVTATGDSSDNNLASSINTILSGYTWKTSGLATVEQGENVSVSIAPYNKTTGEKLEIGKDGDILQAILNDTTNAEAVKNLGRVTLTTATNSTPIATVTVLAATTNIALTLKFNALSATVPVTAEISAGKPTVTATGYDSTNTTAAAVVKSLKKLLTSYTWTTKGLQTESGEFVKTGEHSVSVVPNLENLNNNDLLEAILATDDGKAIQETMTKARIQVTIDNPTTTVTVTGDDKLDAEELTDDVLISITAADKNTITSYLTSNLPTSGGSDSSASETPTTVSDAASIHQAMQAIIKDQLDFTKTPEVTTPGEEAGEGSESETEEIRILASATYDVTYTNADGDEQYNNFAGGYLRVELDIPVEEQTTTETDNADDANEKSYYLVAHLVTHDGDKDPYIEYLMPETDGDKLVVNVKSLSLFTVLKTNAEVQGVPYANAEETPADDTTDDKKTDTASVAPAAKADDSGAIILAGAVVATVVVGGIIYYNWDKLPVHKIEGTVVDANGAAVANATVTLAKDGKVVKTITTDANGYYSAKVAKGDYTITVTVGEASATAEGSTGASAQLAIA
jgi:hypothetical protein